MKGFGSAVSCHRSRLVGCFRSSFGAFLNGVLSSNSFPPPTAMGAAALAGWKECKDEDGTPFYYNSITKESTWEKPDVFLAMEQLAAARATGMEVEDSPGQEDFRPVAKAKRKKTTETKVDDGQVMKKLLNNNKFSPLAEENKNNNNANPAVENTTPVVPTSGSTPGGKKQPPLVVKNTSLAHLAKVMASCDIQPEHKLTRSGTKLTCFSSEDFEKVQAHLIKHKLEFYTHGKRCDRAHRVVIRGLPNMEPELIKKLLKENHQLDALAVYAIKRRQQLPAVEETPFIVLFPKGHTSLKELNSKVKKVGPVVIRWEAYRNKAHHVTQCKNCLQFGHGSSNCHLKPRCNSCGGSHSTDGCKAEESQVTKCANCSGSHEGLDRSCPKREQFIQSRQQASKPKPPAWKKAKRNPTEPTFNAEEFPPLPGAMPAAAQKGKHPRPGGCNQGNPHPGGTTNQPPRPAGRSPGAHPGGGKEEKEEEVLYSSAELWGIYLEFSARLKRCNSRSEQGKVMAYLLFKFEGK